MANIEYSREFVLEGFRKAISTPKSQWTLDEQMAMDIVKQMADNMTPEQKREQRISFAYGNLAIEDPNVTREEIARICDDRTYYSQ